MSQRARGFTYIALGAFFALMLPLLVACGGETAAPTSAPVAGGTTPTTGAAVATTAPTAAATSAAGGATTPTTAAARAPSPATGSPSASPRPSGSPAAAGGGGDRFPSGGKNSTLEPPGKKGGHITEVSFADGKTLNPMLTSDTASAAYITMMFDALLNVNPDDGTLFAELAETVPTLDNGGISKDGLTYTFKLKRGVKWHDGQPFTSKDVVYTYQTMMKKESGSPRAAELTDRLESVTAPDENTVVFKTKKVVAPFLTSNMYNIAAEHIFGNVPVDQVKSDPGSTGDPNRTVGTGPFKFKEWVKDDHFTVAKNKDYYRGEPALDEYIFKVVKDANVVAATLKTGEGDYGTITAALWDEMQKEQNLTTVKWDTFGFTFYAYNLDPAKTTLFQDKRVRQALLYGLDRDAMVKAILFGLGTVAHGTMPTPSWAYAADKVNPKYSYDPKKAEQLLDEAGWRKGGDGVRAKDGQRMAFTLWTNAGNKTREQYVTVMQQQWKAIGVDATPKTEEWNAFLTRITETHDFEIQLVGFSWGVEPDQTTMWATESFQGGFNMNKYSNQRVDQLLKQGLEELDQEKRKQVYIEMQNILADELPSVILDFPQGTAALNKRVKNMYPNAINLYWNAHTWWVTDGK